MDINNLKIRLKRLYASLNARFDDSDKSIITKTTISKNEHKFEMSIAQPDEAEAQNIILDIVEHLAKLKDHIKNTVKQKNINPQKIEDEINTCPYLKIIIDISNAEKHGYPLTKPERSKKSPRISNIKQSLALSVGPNEGSFYSMTFDPITGRPVFHGDGSHNVVITGEIIDRNNVKICSLDKLIEESVKSWEKIIKKFNCI